MVSRKHISECATAETRGGLATAAEDHIGFQSSQPRTGIEVSTGSVKLGSFSKLSSSEEPFLTVNEQVYRWTYKSARSYRTSSSVSRLTGGSQRLASSWLGFKVPL